MPSFLSVSSKLILPSATAIPISELNRLLRQECRFDRCTTSPQAGTTTPCCRIIADVDPISSTCPRISPTIFADHPARSGDANCFHSAPGTLLDCPLAASTNPSSDKTASLKWVLMQAALT